MRIVGRLLSLFSILFSLLAVAAYGIPATAQTQSAASTVPSGLTYTLTSVNSGMVMDVQYGSTSPGAKIVQWPLNGGANQEWTITQAGSGAYTLASAQGGLCLEAPADRTQLYQNPCTGLANQQWSLRQLSDGSYTLTNIASGLLADVSGASKDQAAPVIQYSADNGTNQRWKLSPLTRVGTWTAGLERSGPAFTNQSLRMVVHASVAGALVRVRVSNLYGTAPLSVGAVDVAVQSSNGSAVGGSHHPVTFGGSASATVTAGGDLVSDPIPMHVDADQDLLVSLYLPNATGASTFHQQASETTYLSTAGNHVADDSAANYPKTSGSWYFLAGVDVISPNAVGTVAAVGDSITDGVGSTPGTNRRWPDDLARRMNSASGGTTRGVVNAGIGSNRVLTDVGTMNPSLLSRFGHDVLDQPNVKDVILLEGINDIGNNAGPNGGAVTAQDLESGYQTVINQAHAQGLKIYGATILPFQGASYYSTYGESVRESVNDWIRSSGAFDAVIDFDSVMRSSSNPLALNSAYDSGDHLHPNDTGYQAMANAIDLHLFTP